ncbi:MAG: pirin family protein [Woeseiaceae bacterium]|nr:pirin family protein [Woeseiaceae bacterium]
MMDIIRSEDRGAADHGWLKAKHTFSFADYHNPERMGFRSLRVINEDRIEPGHGFGTHPHRDMEIVTYIIEGALEHKDSMGNGSVIRAGDVQRMTAGTGVFHSEFNHSQEDQVHLLQIWILPGRPSLQPGYEQLNFGRDDKLNKWRLIGSSDGRDGSVTIHQDVELYATILESDHEVEHAFAAGRRGFLQIVSGSAVVEGETLDAGDAMALDGVETLTMSSQKDTEALLFDLA